MKKIVLSIAALVAVSGIAVAERSQDLRSSDTYYGEFAEPSTIKRVGIEPEFRDEAPLVVVPSESTGGSTEIPGLGNQGG
jgi:hypothetical protein